MIIRVIIAICAVAAIIGGSTASAWWQSVQQVAISGGASYIGPGDCSGCPSAANAKVWVGFRGFTASDTADAADVCLPSDTTCAHLTLSNGDVVVPGSLSTCNITTVICTVKTLFDKSGANNCSGPCDLTEATEANRPSFRPAMASNGCATTAKPCMLMRTTSQMSSAVMPTAVTQPATIPMVVKTANDGAHVFINNGGNMSVDTWTSANTVLMYAGSLPSLTMSNGTFHAFQAVFNGASSDANIDGTQNTIDTGTNAVANNTPFSIGDGSANTEVWEEFGIYNTAFSTGQSSALSTNAHSYWGF